MIENLPQMRQTVEEALGGKCYYEYPQTKIPKTKPFAVISMVGNYPALTEHDLKDVIAQITYNIHIYARSQTSLLELVGKVSDACSSIGFTRVALSPLWEHPAHGPYQILTVQALLDKRGNTFTYM